jgi:glutathione S-transferase
MTNTEGATLRIHGLPPSTFTRAVRLGCHEKGFAYELVPTMPSAARALNPFAKIPAIVHGDFTLFESVAILRYLDRSFPGPKLWPDDPRGAALVDQWAGAVCDSVRNSAQLYMAARFNLLPAPAEMVVRYLEQTRAVIAAFDRQLGRTRFLAGDALSAADLLFVPPYFYFPDIPELKAIAEASPNCRRWAAEMASRPSVQATEPMTKPGLPTAA